MKEKLRTHIGTPAQHQRLILKNSGIAVCEMADDHRMLGYYSVKSGMEIHIIDTDPYSLSRGGGLTDTSLVQKYQISDDAYDKRKGTVRDFIRQKKLEDPNYKKPVLPGAGGFARKTVPADDEPVPGPETVSHVTVGARCEVQPGGRRGEVKFVGKVDGLKGGFWVGVRLDEPLGKNDGTVKGVAVFECPVNHGTFVRGKNIVVGDYPERSLLDDGEDGFEIDADEIDEI